MLACGSSGIIIRNVKALTVGMLAACNVGLN